MEKILILSDLCVGATAGDETRLLDILSHATARHGDAKAVVLAGGLARRRRAEDYALLARGLAKLKLPALAVPGPDESRTQLAATFPDLARTESGAMQSVTDLGRHRLITLDTRAGKKPRPKAPKNGPGARSDAPHRPGAGVLCPDRMAWLMHALEEGADRHRTVLMHHGPVKTGMPCADALRLQDGSELLDLLASYPGTQIIFAHAQRRASGISRGVPWHALGSLTRPVALDLDGAEPRLGEQPASYAVLLLQKRGSTLHHHEMPR